MDYWECTGPWQEGQRAISFFNTIFKKNKWEHLQHGCGTTVKRFAEILEPTTHEVGNIGGSGSTGYG